MKNKTYLRILFFTFGSIFTLVIVYVFYFSKNYPLPITGHLSLDAKLKFVRDYILPEQVDTLIIGSSIGLNNIQGSYLEKQSPSVNKVVNLSVFGATTLQAEQLMQLGSTFPNLKRIIYSVQYPDTTRGFKFENYDPFMLEQYMKHELNAIQYGLLIFNSCKNIFFCIRRQYEWKHTYMIPTAYEFLGFDSSGSVPLRVYGKDIIGHRWKLPQPGIMRNGSFQAMSKMAQDCQKKDILFYVVHQPYRKPLYEKYASVRGALAYFDKKSEEAITLYNGILLKMQNLHLEDSYFSDRTHLNNEGSLIVTEELARNIDSIEGTNKE